jgi:hypothetical protein
MAGGEIDALGIHFKLWDKGLPTLIECVPKNMGKASGKESVQGRGRQGAQIDTKIIQEYPANRAVKQTGGVNVSSWTSRKLRMDL